MSKSSSKKKEEKKRKRVKTSNPSDDEYEEDIVMEDLDLHKIPQPEVKLEDTVLGFTDLGHKEEKEEQIEAPLPQWMKNPNSIPDNKVPLSELASSIDGNIMRNITELGFTEFFPVQRELLPVLSRPRIFGGDLCVSAPTGSGKTLTYVIPIVQDLMNRVVIRTRAVIIVPNRDLVSQVKTVFDQVSVGLDLKIRAWINYEDVYKSKLKKTFLKRHVDDERYDIWISTPDGLMQQLENNPNFDLQHLKYLVLDEADQLLERGNGRNNSSVWTERLLDACYKSSPSHEGEISTIREKNPPRFNPREEPLYKILLSATMSKDPSELAHLQLVNPQFYTTSVLYTLPSTLKQFVVHTTILDKPLVLLHMLVNAGLQRVLCFTSSVNSTHKLYLLLQSILGEKVAEFSGKVDKKQRGKILQNFSEGKIQIVLTGVRVVCSDVMSRGLDLSNVENVIQYELPISGETHVHRCGRTARAGRSGNNYMLIEPHQTRKMKQILSSVSGVEETLMKYKESDMEKLRDSLQKAGAELKDKLAKEATEARIAPQFRKKVAKKME